MSDGSHSHIYSSDVVSGKYYYHDTIRSLMKILTIFKFNVLNINVDHHNEWYDGWLSASQEMRAQSGSSSGGSFSSTSKASYNNTPRSLNTRSQFFFPVNREVKSEIEKNRPRSEILSENSSDSQRENLRASSMPPFTSLSVDLPCLFVWKLWLMYGTHVHVVLWLSVKHLDFGVVIGRIDIILYTHTHLTTSDQQIHIREIPIWRGEEYKRRSRRTLRRNESLCTSNSVKPSPIYPSRTTCNRNS